jgi:hypothetical protein
MRGGRGAIMVRSGSRSSTGGRARRCERQSGPRSQRGQALVYGLFLLVGGLAAFALMFNAGQLTAEKTKLVNTADAVAYSGGVMQARALNFTAYTNRALVANEVLIAQTVSLQSWARFVQSRVQTLQLFPECHTASGAPGVAAQAVRYGVDYALMCRAVVLPGVGAGIVSAAQSIDTGLGVGVAALELNKASIVASQWLLHAPFVFQALRNETMQEVADANYRGDGAVRVEPALTAAGGLLTLTDGWASFTRRYAGDERTRMAEATRAAAGSDDFVRSRQWDSEAVLPNPACLPWRLRHDAVRRRGGTELVDFDEWRAEDTESWWTHAASGFLSRRCRAVEATPIGHGFSEAHAEGQDRDHSAAAFGNSRENSMAHALMDAGSSTRQTSYSGIPGYFDLAPAFLNQADGDPRLDLAVRVVRPRAEIRTSDARSQVPGGDRINNYPTTLASDEMAAVSASQVYFARPSEHARNAFGQRIFGAARAEEIGSLFNPFWQVRLIDPRADVNLQRLRQAAGS